MSLLNTLRALGPIDARSIRRDSMLRWMILMPLVLALMFRLLLPWATVHLQESLNFDLTPYLPLLVGFVVILTAPTLYGAVIGFLLLDERDEGTLTALQVTPLPVSSYLAYRIALPMAISIVVLLIAYPIVGLFPLPLWQLLILAVLAAPLAPLYALFLAVLASNKVQGFALMKAGGILFLGPFIAWFVTMPWQLLFGVFPTYWPMKLYWLFVAGQSGWAIYFVVGMIFQAALVGLLLRRFNTVMRR
jgi:fluoroquinolone transport system permease protein